MGAGNYYFKAPAGEEWSKMIYVQLNPTSWDDECDRRKNEFEQFLINDSSAAAQLLRSGSDSEALEDIKRDLRSKWLEDNYGGPGSEQSFHEDLAESQKETIYDALSEAFDQCVREPERWSEEIDDARVLCEVGRMAICQAYTYYGTDMALIVTPKSNLQETIWSIENRQFAYESGWSRHYLEEMRAENVRLASIKRSVESGALHREMTKAFETMTRSLHWHGLSTDMWFRNGAWMGSSYKGSDLFAANQAHLDRQLKKLQRKTKSATATALSEPGAQA